MVIDQSLKEQTLYQKASGFNNKPSLFE